MQVMFVCLFFSTIISICAQEEKKLEKHFFFFKSNCLFSPDCPISFICSLLFLFVIVFRGFPKLGVE